VLWALALEGLPPAKQAELLELVAGNENDGTPAPVHVTLARVRELYDEAGVFDKASRLIEKHRERAEKIADELEPEELRALLYYLIDSVLDHAQPASSPALTTIQ
jgi:geranylgeranyl diphosphate synthase type II